MSTARTAAPGEPGTGTAFTRRAIWGTALLTGLLVALWGFPATWYTKTDPGQKRLWLTEQTDLPGWDFQKMDVGESIERLLAADRTFCGEFRKPGSAEVVRVFAATRYEEKPNDIGLFVHTPDRCWTESGWGFDPVVPDHVEVTVHGVPIVFERRVFVFGGQRELVYFGGLVGGQALPYRLDHNLSVGMRHALRTAVDRTGTTARATDRRFWERVWDSFVSRRPLLGPKQFFRVSTQVAGGDLAPQDRLLAGFLERWLLPADLERERAAWQAERDGNP